MARYLDVYLNADLAGLLEQDDGGSLAFRYHPDWLAAPGAVPLSASLPLHPEAFRRRECRPFFAGLLPEEGQRRQIARAVGVSERNDFALLEKIGGECAGAVSLMPPGERPPDIADRIYQPLTPDELADKLAALPKRPLLAGEAGVRLSLAGAQSKLAVAIQDGNCLLPLHGAPSTHILKPPSPFFGHLAENEWFCLRLAAAIGLDVAAASLGGSEGARFLMVQRYDRRRREDGTVERLHQEDFCQALGIPPEMKYQQEGGAGLRQCFELVRAVSAAPAVDVLRLFDAVVFNFLIGNGDAHGKNFSLLHADGRTRLAPLYDLVCTQVYPDLDTRLAMKIGHERDPERVSREDWRRCIAEAGLGAAPAFRRATALARAVRQAVKDWPAPPPETEAVRGCVLRNSEHLAALGE